MKKLLKSEVCGSINNARDPLMCLFCCEKSRVEKSKTTAEKKKKRNKCRHKHWQTNSDPNRIYVKLTDLVYHMTLLMHL